jgi:acyl transferase domain-containing protein/acyl-CoA synthetase (AMP-forming)/AMP-acid ligase II/NRPS condensation-like uncharacterized protein
MNQGIAIVGIAGRFPHAENLNALLANFRNGVDSVGELSDKRRLATTLPQGEKYMVAGYLDDIDRFDHDFFNISKGEACTMDPHQRIILETVYESFENAGYNIEDFRGSNTGVFAADAELEYYKHADQIVPTLASGNTKAFLASRINRQFGFNGPSLLVDTTCSSSLLAVHLACNELRLGQIDQAVVCAVHMCLFPYLTQIEGLVELNSADGKSRAFSDRANGMSVGEGSVSIILKPYEKALRDKDIIHAVITGYASNSNADKAASLTAPDSVAQADVLVRAWENAKINPKHIGYIEAHGSGTVLGDSIEIGGLNLAFNKYGSEKQICAISTAKSNLGHTRTVAGLTGLIRSLLSLKTGTLFPTVHFDTPHPLINFADSAVYVNQALVPWPADKSHKRIAGVSSIGLSGTNCHVVMEATPKMPETKPDNGWYSIPVSAKSPAGLVRNFERLKEHLNAEKNSRLQDISHTRWRGRAHFRHRKCIVANSVEALQTQLHEFAGKPLEADKGKQTAKLIFVFDDQLQVNEKFLNEVVALHPAMKAAYTDIEIAFKSEGIAVHPGFAWQYCFCHWLKECGASLKHVIGIGTGKTIVRWIKEEIDLRTAIKELKNPVARDEKDYMARVGAMVQDLTKDAYPIFIHLTESKFHDTLRQLSVSSDAFKVTLLESNSETFGARALQLLYESGATLNWLGIAEARGGSRVELPSYSFEPTRCWIRETPKEALTEPNAAKRYAGDTVLQNGGTIMQRKVAAYWASELKISHLLIDSNFFDLGGNSISATKVINKLNKEFNLRLDFEDLFDYPELRKFADLANSQWTTKGKLKYFWCETLKADNIQYGDDFFQLGGHSIIANQVINSIQKEFNVTLDFELFFSNPTINQQAAFIDASLAKGAAAQMHALVKVPDRELYAPADAQKRIWLACQAPGGSTLYNLSDVYEIKGDFHANAFQKALRQLMVRHEILRTAFVTVEGELKQRIIPSHLCEPDFELVDLRNEKDALQQAALLESERHEFDLEAGKLLRAKILQLDHQKYRLLFTRHHIISDGWSLAILIRELLVFYHAEKNAVAANLPPLHLQYRDYSEWSNRFLENAGNGAREYWHQHFSASVPDANFPIDSPRNEQPSFRGDVQRYVVDAPTRDELVRLSQKNGVSLFVMLMACLKTVIYRYTRCEDLAIGSILAGRVNADLENQIGFYANTVVLRSQPSGKRSFRELLHDVKTSFFNAHKYQHYPYNRLVDDLNIKRDRGRNPLFDFMLILQNNEIDNEQYALGMEGVKITKIEQPVCQSPFDILFNFTELPDGLELLAIHSTEIFKRETIEGLAAALKNVFVSVIGNENVLLDEISFSQPWNERYANGQIKGVEVLDEKHNPLPAGMVGVIHLDESIYSSRLPEPGTVITKEGTKYRATEILARWTTSGSLEILSEDSPLLVVGSELLSKSTMEKLICNTLDVEWGAIKVSRHNYLAYVCSETYQFDWHRARTALSQHLPASFLQHLTLIPLPTNNNLEAFHNTLIGADEFIKDCDVASAEADVKELAAVTECRVLMNDIYQGNGRLHLKDLNIKVPGGDRKDNTSKSTAEGNSMAHPESPALLEGEPLLIGEDDVFTLTEALVRLQRTSPEKGIWFYHEKGETFLSYAALYEGARRAVTGLSKGGIQKGQPVILLLAQSPEYFMSLWGCILAGVIPVTVAIPSEFKEGNSVVGKLASTWNALGHPHIILGEENVAGVHLLNKTTFQGELKFLVVQQLMEYPPCAEDFKTHRKDVAFYQLSSGSTGTPKVIPEIHESIVYYALGARQGCNHLPENVSLSWIPVDHVASIIFSHFRDIYIGMTQVQLDTNSFLSDPTSWLYLVEKYKVTHSWGPNFTYKLVAEAIRNNPDKRWDLSSVLMLMNGGEQVTYRVLVDFVEATLPMGLKESGMLPSYGMAEVCTVITENHGFALSDGFFFVEKNSVSGKIRLVDTPQPHDWIFAVVGAARPGIKIRIANDSNEILEEGRIGRIQIHSPSCTVGYLGLDQQNKESFLPGGWYMPGDLGFILNGKLAITGREKEMIIVRGNHYYYYDLEDVVSKVSGVEPTFAACCGTVQDDDERLIIFYTPSVQSAEEQLKTIKDIRRTITASFGIAPHCVIPVEKEAFHKTTSGKIQRTLFKSLYLSGAYDPKIKEIDLLEKNSKTIEDYFFSEKWFEKDLAGADRVDSGEEVVLLFSNDPKTTVHIRECMSTRKIIAVEKASRFAVKDNLNVTVNPQHKRDYAQLLAHVEKHFGSVVAIVNAWMFNQVQEQEWTEDNIENKISEGIFGLVYLMNAIPLQWLEELKMVYITSQARCVESGEPVAPGKTTVYGALKSLEQEHPGVRTLTVDIPHHEKALLPYIIQQELARNDQDTVVAYRTGKRYCLGLEKLNVNPSFQKESFTKNGFYLITGGLGELGYHVAEFLLDHFDAHIMLIGQTDLEEERGSDADERQLKRRRLKDLKSKSQNIRYFPVDVCDDQRLDILVSELERSWNLKLAGVIHAAGAGSIRDHWQNVDSHFIRNESVAYFKKMFRSKVNGSISLHKLLRNRNDVLFVAFSSVNSYFGGRTFSAYSAANSFLDHFVKALGLDTGIRAVTIDWSMWDNMGMSRNNALAKLTYDKGYCPITATDGMHALLVALHSGYSQVFVGLDASNVFIRKNLVHQPERTQSVTVYYEPNALGVEKGGIMLATKKHFSPEISIGLVEVEEWPLTAEGTISDEALRKLGNSDHADGNQDKPASHEEFVLLELWKGVLKRNSMGVFDNFFELGGDSIKATQVISTVYKKMNVKITLSQLFSNPTIYGLSKVIRESDVSLFEEIKPVSEEPYYEVSHSQKQLWILDQMEVAQTAYNIPGAYWLSGNLNVSCFERAVQEIIRRHEILRTSFVNLGGVPKQRVHPFESLSFNVEVVDLTKDKDSVRTATRIANQIKAISFDLSVAPLIVLKLLKVADQRYGFIFNMHHIIADGWSFDVLTYELSTLYNAFLNNLDNPLKPLAVQYKDYAAWLKNKLSGEPRKALQAFWMNQMEGKLPYLNLVTDFQRPAQLSFRGDYLTFDLDEQITAELKKYCLQNEATMFITLLTALKVLMYKYTGDEDIIIGSPVLGRNHEDLNALVGLFLNAIPIRTTFFSSDSGNTMLQKVKRSTLDSFDHDLYPIDQLVDDLGTERHANRSPLYNVVIIVQNFTNEREESFTMQDVRIESIETDYRISKNDITFQFSEYKETVISHIEFNTDLFKKSTIAKMKEDFLSILQQILNNDSVAISDLDLDLKESEQNEIEEIEKSMK